MKSLMKFITVSIVMRDTPAINSTAISYKIPMTNTRGMNTKIIRKASASITYKNDAYLDKINVETYM